ncbi:hypothetical protein Scep_003902 [Stephania cephalantha]|uniref:Arf-GAP domain-containing protein n=1 Tax=Stephania cephalantha TaxID=152367 RepID=A0AAP0PUX1_9MAGN
MKSIEESRKNSGLGMSSQREQVDHLDYSSSSSGQHGKLEDLFAQPGNNFCADCGSPDPKWVLSVKLDEWTDEEVDSILNMGGNTAANKKYEAVLPNNFRKPKPDSANEERTDFIRKKYELQQFLKPNTQNSSSHTSTLSSSSKVFDPPNRANPSSSSSSLEDKKCWDKQASSSRSHGLGHAFRNSWRKKEPENKTSKKSHSTVASSKVYDKDTFSTDDHMGEAEINILPLVSAAKAYENSDIQESMQLGRWIATKENTLVKDSVINLVDGKVKQEILLRLQNVERGVLEIELECIPLSQ